MPPARSPRGDVVQQRERRRADGSALLCAVRARERSRGRAVYSSNAPAGGRGEDGGLADATGRVLVRYDAGGGEARLQRRGGAVSENHLGAGAPGRPDSVYRGTAGPGASRSEEHTSELQSRFGISYAVFCLQKK